MAHTFRIPKLSDREITLALIKIRDELGESISLKLKLHPPQKVFEVTDAPLDQQNSLKYIFDLNSQIVGTFQLLGQRGHEVVIVRRESDKITDTLQIPDDWVNYIPDSERPKLHISYANLLTSLRLNFNIADVEAAYKGDSDSAWNRYRDAQTAVINSLQQATETLIIKAAEKNAELDKARAERFEKLEVTLREQLEHERKTLQAELEKKQQQLEERQQAIAERESSFNTKEARYVARKKQEEQIDQVKNWLSDWRLTTGTTAKRRPIFWAYIAALVITGALTAYATYHNYQLLKSADDIAKLAWWNWVAITTKSFFPLAAFTTFMVYFIRWSGSWARQHADEEFRNRTRLIDIGRSGWLLEAVRDAQEKGNEIPVDLLKELSRNLFSNAGSNEGDIHPQAVSDLLLQGLSSVRVKSADGSEVEATRSSKKK